MPISVETIQDTPADARRLPKLSIVSLLTLAIGVLVMASTLVVVFADNMFIAGTTGRPYRESLTVHVLSFSSYALPAISILGGTLGTAGLLSGGRGKTLAWLCVVGNAVIFLVVCSIVALAFLFEGYGSTP